MQFTKAWFFLAGKVFLLKNIFGDIFFGEKVLVVKKNSFYE